MIDIEKARALSDELRQWRGLRYEASVTIDALLDENRKAWTTVGEVSVRLAEVLNERDALARELEQLRLAVDRMTR